MIRKSINIQQISNTNKMRELYFIFNQRVRNILGKVVLAVK